MKKSILFFSLLLCLKSFEQVKKQPLFAFLSETKDIAEFKLQTILKKQTLIVDTLKDSIGSDDKIKQKQILQNFIDASGCIEKYSQLKTNVDKLISQLKSDLTISNSKKIIRKLNKGNIDTMSFYHSIISDINQSNNQFVHCEEEEKEFAPAAASVSDITGIFTALVTVFTSARDFRAQQIKSLCDQLESLRLSGLNDLGSNSSASLKSKE